jgi:uncharacterized membrane protein YhaH (DUF805 family)
MNFGEAISSGFRNYVGFTGRAARSEFWYWILFEFLLTIVTGFIDLEVLGSREVFPLTSLTSLGLLLPYLAVSIRRLHDIDRRGWWFLIYFIPLVGLIFWFIWNCTRGTTGANRFGPDPLPGTT